MFRRFMLYLFLTNTIVSCTLFKANKEENKEPVARVNDVYLYQEDILIGLPKNYKKKDSALLVRNYIKTWAKQQLLLDKAKINLKEEVSAIDKLVNKYKQDLLVNKYREAIISQNLDTIVNMRDIDGFYMKNKEILTLKEKIIKLKFIQISKNIIDKEKIIALFKSDEKEDIGKLIERELEFKSFYFNDSTWIEYADVLRLLPMLQNDFKSIRQNSYLEKEDESDLYLIRVKDKMDRNNMAPINYVVPTIKQMILHTRKLELLKKIEKTLLIDANKKGQYEIYK